MTQIAATERRQASREVRRTRREYGLTDIVEAAARTIYNATQAFRSLRAAIQHVNQALSSGRRLWVIVASFLF